eukprot:Gb_07883 [translate_table: standard]
MDPALDFDYVDTPCQKQRKATLFQGIRFILAGFDPVTQNEYATVLQRNGAFNVGKYDRSSTHVIVCNLTYDDPICAAARKDGKILVTHLWVADSLDRGVLVDTDKIDTCPNMPSDSNVTVGKTQAIVDDSQESLLCSRGKVS